CRAGEITEGGVAMAAVTGQMLRLLRERQGIGLRAVARRSRGGMALSDSHLSRVERGERQVTPAVMAAYERAIGIPITVDVISDLAEQHPHQDREWERFHSNIAMLAGGGLVGHDPDRLLDEGSGYVGSPTRVGHSDVVQVEQAAVSVRSLGFRQGGELAGYLATQVLRWASGMYCACMANEVRRRLDVAIGSVAAWAGWSACDSHRFGAARALLEFALGAAVRADEPDLRAHVLVDIAGLRHHLGCPTDALRVLRLADGDERIGPAVQSMLHGARARVYAGMGERDVCEREVQLVEDAAARVEPQAVPDWLGGWEFAHVQAICGHAYGQLAEVSGSLAELTEAHKRLSNEVISARIGEVAVFEVGEYESCPDEVADSAGAGGGVFQGVPSAGEQG